MVKVIVTTRNTKCKSHPVCRDALWGPYSFGISPYRPLIEAGVLSHAIDRLPGGNAFDYLPFQPGCNRWMPQSLPLCPSAPAQRYLPGRVRGEFTEAELALAQSRFGTVLC